MSERERNAYVEDPDVGYIADVHEPGTHTVLEEKFKSTGFDTKTKGKEQLRDSWTLCPRKLHQVYILETMPPFYMMSQPMK